MVNTKNGNTKLFIVIFMRWAVVRRPFVVKPSVSNLQNQLLLKNQQLDFDETSKCSILA